MVCPVKAEAMKDDLVSTLKPAEDCTPLGFHSSVLSRREPGVFTNTNSPQRFPYRPTAMM